MSARFLLVSSDKSVASAVRSALDNAASLIELGHLTDKDDAIGERYEPDGVIIDSDVRNGVQTAFERVAAAKRKFPAAPIVVLGNEMSAQLVLAALRAGATDFLDRDAGVEQIRLALQSCLTKADDVQHRPRSRIAGVLSALPSEQDQDFALNLAIRAAGRMPDGMTLYIDLSLPATQAGIALGMELEFGVPDAIREVARVDRALLESAVARDPVSGIYILPLCANFESEPVPLDATGFAALLQVLRGICDVVIINYGPFSRQKALVEMVQPAAQLFVCCSQRFPSIRGTSDLLRWLSEGKLDGTTRVVVHELAPGQTPSPADIRNTLKISDSIDLEEAWEELAEHVNQGKPLALSNTRYSRSLDDCLSCMGIAIETKPDLAARLRSWLLLESVAEAS